MTIVLSTGHAFANNSVTAITPILVKFRYSSDKIYDQFQVIGVGFNVEINLTPRKYIEEFAPSPLSETIRQEFIDKLLPST